MRPSPSSSSLPPALRREGMTFAARPSRGVPIVMVPAEHVLMLTVELPIQSARKRLAAAPFAIEDHLAQDIGATHVALGPQIAPNQYIVAVVTIDLMERWIAALNEAHLSRARLVPDALSLPSPKSEGDWTVGIIGQRALVRRGDGTAFAVSTDTLATLWKATGSPAIATFGDALPKGITPAQRIARPTRPDFGTGFLDLRQGDFAVGGTPSSGGWLRAAAITLAVGAAAHGAIDIADARAVQSIAAEKRDDAARLLEKFGSSTQSDDPVTDLARLIPVGASARRPGFLDLFARTSDALAGARTPVSVTTLAYDGEVDALTLDIEITDLPALQQIGQALDTAGLSAESGPASTANGATTARLLVYGTGAKR